MLAALAAALAASILAPMSAQAARSGSPTNTAPPEIAKTPVEGKTLGAKHGTWSGAVPIQYSYAWSRCSSAGTECATITGAASHYYRPVGEDVGHRLLVTVTATNGEGASEASSSPSAVVAARAPKHGKSPAITGQAVDGRLLSVAEGAWKGTAPLAFTYQWERCKGHSCTAIVGAEGTTYRAQTADIGDRLRVRITAKNGAGTASEHSKRSAKVVPGSPLNLEAPKISGVPTVEQTLTAEEGVWVGTPPIAYTYQWYSCAPLGECELIAGATEKTYTVQPLQAGDGFEVVVTATNAYGRASATSPETSAAGGGAKAPSNVIAPRIVGLAVTGQTLNATEGTWEGSEPIGYSYQWELCNASGGACEELVGATESKYTIPAGEVGDTLRVIVTATNGAGHESATSEPSMQILGLAPSNTEAPSISGTATAGQPLTASAGKWSGTEPIAYEYEWLRCNASGGECSSAQAKSALPAYVVAAGDVGHTLRVKVYAKNIAGEGSAESAATAVVTGVAPKNMILPVIVGAPVSGTASTATEGTWEGTEPISYSFQWLHCNASGGECSEISGARTSKYTPTATEAGKSLKVKVVAKNVAGGASVESLPTVPIVL